MQEREEKGAIFEINYILDRKNAADALIKRHFEKNRTKVVVHSALFSILAVYFIFSLIVRIDGMSALLLVVCVLGLVSVFYSPISQSKAMAEKFGNGIDFRLDLFETSLVVTAGSDSKNEIPFESLKCVAENDSYYYFEAEKRLFPVPKCTDKQKEISNFLAQKVQNRYKSYCKKQKNKQ